jgi:hypothetical protein
MKTPVSFASSSAALKARISSPKSFPGATASPPSSRDSRRSIVAGSSSRSAERRRSI